MLRIQLKTSPDFHFVIWVQVFCLDLYFRIFKHFEIRMHFWKSLLFPLARHRVHYVDTTAAGSYVIIRVFRETGVGKFVWSRWGWYNLHLVAWLAIFIFDLLFFLNHVWWIWERPFVLMVLLKVLKLALAFITFYMRRELVEIPYLSMVIAAKSASTLNIELGLWK